MIVGYRKIAQQQQNYQFKQSLSTCLASCLDKIKTKNIRIAFQNFIVVIGEEIYDAEFADCQKKRKDFYDHEN